MATLTLDLLATREQPGGSTSIGGMLWIIFRDIRNQIITTILCSSLWPLLLLPTLALVGCAWHIFRILCKSTNSPRDASLPIFISGLQMLKQKKYQMSIFWMKYLASVLVDKWAQVNGGSRQTSPRSKRVVIYWARETNSGLSLGRSWKVAAQKSPGINDDACRACATF